MGCVVNGPGEAREADLGIAAGRKRGHLFIKGQVVRVVPEDEMVAALVEEAERLVAEGVEARLAAADAGAAAEAEADRQALLDEPGRRRQPQRGKGRADPQAHRVERRACTLPPTRAAARDPSGHRRRVPRLRRRRPRRVQRGAEARAPRSLPGRRRARSNPRRV